MRFKITMKDPDGFFACIEDAAKEMADQVTCVDEEDREAVADQKQGELRELCQKWFRYNEYLTVEIDTDAGSISVVPNRL